MLNNYQILEQLKIIKKSLSEPYDAPKKEALEYAIVATIEKIENKEPCVFDLGHECRILTSRNCFKCSFKCNKKQFEDAQRKVKERHKKLGINLYNSNNS